MEAIRAWVDKIGQIRLAYSMIKNELGDSKAFYEMLYNLYKQRNHKGFCVEYEVIKRIVFTKYYMNQKESKLHL